MSEMRTAIFKLKHLKFLFISFLMLGCKPAQITHKRLLWETENLLVQKITDNVYQHITFLSTQSFGKVACNGMIVIDKNEAVVFDTPADSKTAAELIKWVENNLHCKIKAIIPTHFHADCLGGLDAFHEREIPSFANNLTIKLAGTNNATSPQNGFDDLLELKVGDKKVFVQFLGQGHTRDNVIGYFPDDEVVFGGCLIKELGAGKGNLEDANVQDWPFTIVKVKEKFPKTKIVIPGHGKVGGTELFDYTIKLFEAE